MRSIDLNADLGESFGVWTYGDDRALLDVVSSANIACGFHGGDPVTIRRTCEQAVHAGVTIGAHPGFRDLVGFGRRHIDIAPAELRAETVYQIGALRALARSVGGDVSYVKPHGALYHAVATRQALAEAFVGALEDLGEQLPLVGPPGSLAAEVAERRGIRTVAEAFADRRYTPGGQLVSRTQPGAVLTDTEEVVAQALSIAVSGSVTAIDGTEVHLGAQTLCLHGDTPGAFEHALAVRAALSHAGVSVAAFV